MEWGWKLLSSGSSGASPLQPAPLPVERQCESDGDSDYEMVGRVDGDTAPSGGNASGGQQNEPHAFELGELERLLGSADEAGVLQLLQRHVDDRWLDAHTKECVNDKVLDSACKFGHERVIKHVLGTGRDPNRPVNEFGETPLTLSAAKGHTEIVRLLLDAHANVNTSDSQGRTPLHRATIFGHTKVLELLLGAHADANTPDKQGKTSLHAAAAGANTEVVRRLLGAKADVNMPDNQGRTPLNIAARAGRTEVVQLLLEANANVNTPDKYEETPLTLTTGQGHADIVRLLLDAKADVNTPDKQGRTPLNIAARTGKPQVVRLLLEANAGVNAPDKAGDRPLHCAETPGVAQVLLAAGAGIHDRSKDGYHVIHFALFRIWKDGCSPQALRMLQVLIEHGSQWDATCGLIADRVALWPSSMGAKPSAIKMVQWGREAPAIRFCIERWTQEHMQGLPFTEVPVEQIRNGVEATKVYIREFAASRDVTFRRKICVVGPSNWGKTSLVKSLTTEKPSLVHPDDRTIGIDQFLLTFEEQVHELKATKKHEVTFWDFAGQDAYQVAHSLFFSDRTIYIVCIDLESYVIARMQAELMTDTESETDRWMNEFIDTRVLRWIRVICARQQDAEFVFVATKRDRVINANLDGEEGALADLHKRIVNVAVIIEEMKQELETKTTVRQQHVTTENSMEPPAPLPITHLGDERLATMSQKPSVRIVVTSCVSVEDVSAFKMEIQDVIKKSDRSFPMPDKFSLVLEALKQMREKAVASAKDTRVASTFLPIQQLIELLINTIERPVELHSKPFLNRSRKNEEDPYLDERTCRAILQTLRDLGDVLWYDNIDDAMLKDTVILDPELMIDLVRDVFDHNHTSEVITHHTLKGLKFWRHLGGAASMLSMKRVLQYFQLVYPTTGEMLVDSDLIVPAYWKTNTCAFWMFGGGVLRFGRGVHREDVAVRVHFEFQFVNNYPDTLYDNVVVASYSPFYKRDVGPDWIMYKEKELYACRLVVGRDQETHHPMLHLEALQGHSADGEEAETLWETFTLLFESLEKVIRRYPGVVVTRYVREDTEEDVKQTRYTFETLQSFKPTRSSRKWMPPQQTWEACLEFCKK